MTYYATTPIYYVNATPTLGNAYTTIATDILVRHHRQRGEDTFFLTGVDEHASKVWRVAQEQGLDAQEYADRIAVVWRDLAPSLGASPDFFIRTSDDGHKTFVRDFLQRIYDNGDIYEDVYAGWYCVGCEAFKSEDELVDGACPDHPNRPVEWIEEKNYFFRLSAYQERLLELYDSRPDFVLPGFRFNEARSFIAGGLQDFSVSRAGQPWGIPLPWDESQVAYVWVDALINYLSALTYARPGEDLIPTFWPEVHHILGKDILRFHCVFWPALLLAAGYEVPTQLFVHGWLLLDEQKISKSGGNAIDPSELIAVLGVDPLRYWCARAISFGQDGSASLENLHERYERELANDLGNLVSRTTAMIARYRSGRLAQAVGEPPFDAAALRAELVGCFDASDITNALEAIWQRVRRLNQYVEESAPWQLAKDEARAQELDLVLYNLADGLVAIAVALQPYLPETAPQILEALGQPADDVSLDRIRAGTAAEAEGIEPARPLFPRLESPAAAEA